MRGFRELRVWERAHRLTLAVYEATRRFPRDELYGLTSQARRSASSIGANIAEGVCRSSSRDLARFLQIALASASELEYHLLLAADLKHLDAQEHRRLDWEVTGVKRMLATFLQKVRRQQPTADRR